MALTDASKAILASTIKEWTKFITEKEKITQLANELAAITRRSVQECIAFLKSQNIDVQCDSPDDMKILGVSVKIDPIVETAFPNVKASVVLKCAGSTRSIIINPNMSISCGGTVLQFEQFAKGMPVSFATNSADFVRDSFLYVARTNGKEE